MPRLTIRFTEGLHALLQKLSTEEALPMADVVRRAVSREVEAWQASDAETSADGRREIVQLQGQIEKKDVQISELHQLLALTQNNLSELTQQLDRAYLQLEDTRGRKWWRFFRRG